MYFFKNRYSPRLYNYIKYVRVTQVLEDGVCNDYNNVAKTFPNEYHSPTFYSDFHSSNQTSVETNVLFIRQKN